MRLRPQDRPGSFWGRAPGPVPYSCRGRFHKELVGVRGLEDEAETTTPPPMAEQLVPDDIWDAIAPLPPTDPVDRAGCAAGHLADAEMQGHRPP
jgi:hypothetical protein